jgi:hypothetical protein
MKKKYCRRHFAAAVFLLAVSVSGALAQLPPRVWDPRPVAKSFMEFGVIRDDLGGDLDGKLILGTTEKAFFIPKLKPSWGAGIRFGRMLKSGLWTVGYSQTRTTAAFQGRSEGAVSNALEVAGKGFLLTRSAVKPYLRVGFDLVWLRVHAGAIRGDILYNANYMGLGVGGGAGVLVRLSPKVFLTAGGTYRYLAYMYAKGPGRGRDVTNLYVDRTGPRRDIFLKVPGPRFEVTIGYMLR